MNGTYENAGESLSLMGPIDFYDGRRYNQWINAQASPRILLSPAYYVNLHCHTWDKWRVHRGSRGVRLFRGLLRSCSFHDTRPELCVDCLTNGTCVVTEFEIWHLIRCQKHQATGAFNISPPSLAPIICSMPDEEYDSLQDQKKGGISALLYLCSSDGSNSWSEDARDSIMSGLGITALEKRRWPHKGNPCLETFYKARRSAYPLEG